MPGKRSACGEISSGAAVGAQGTVRQAIAAIDLEIHPESERLLSVGACLGGTSLRREIGGDDPLELLRELDSFCEPASLLLGHNLVAHDHAWLARHAPWMRLHRLPRVDTLFLAPLAFPRHPYHKLYKGYKPSPASRNDPLRDAAATLDFFVEERAALMKDPLLPVHLALISGSEGYSGCIPGLKDLVAAIPARTELPRSLAPVLAGRMCEVALASLPKLLDTYDGAALALALAWLATADEKSRLAPWVVYAFPEAVLFLRRAREESMCGSCAYCREFHEPAHALKRFFGFDAFRPISDAPRLTQQDVAEALLRGEDLLVILSTGGGKSLCYQLPGLMLARRRNLLTLVISPLQSLMKDQVDSLRNRGLLDAGTLNGMQTVLERMETIEGIALGSVNLLFVAPEQMRNENFCRILQQRELGLVVIDEAHCLSKWGHDFRPDYLYICKFLRLVLGEGRAFPPIACFTATAKKDVATEIREFFRREGGRDLRVVQGGLDRPNLRFSVKVVELSEKNPIILDILANIGEGAALVFTATRNRAQELAEFLKRRGFRADFFHAGLPAEQKREVQQDFLEGKLRVITATNAFGMGIDKPDVRAVIHADVPGSLESYLQEAGRAGRDGQDAECHLLFCQADLEDQFRLTSRSRITFGDLLGIFRGVKQLALGKRKGRDSNRPAPSRTTETTGEKAPPRVPRSGPGEAPGPGGLSGSTFPADRQPLSKVVKTTGEILREEGTDTETFDAADEMADTKVKIALSWLEKVQVLERTWNRTSVIQAKPSLPGLEESMARIHTLELPGTTRREWGQILNFLFQSHQQDLFNTDMLSDLFGREGEAIQKTFRQMRHAGLIDCNLLFSAILCNVPGNQRNARDRWLRAAKLERHLQDFLSEVEPDENNSIMLHARGVATLLKDRAGIPDAIQEDVRLILQAWQGDGTVLFRAHGFELFNLSYAMTLREVQVASHRRLLAGEMILRHLLALAKPRGLQCRVSFSQNELEELLARAPGLNLESGQEPHLIKKALLALHESRILTLQNGLAVFRPALTLQLNSPQPPRAEDCEDLASYFAEKTAQIHVMGRYAEYAQKEMRDARALVRDYFDLDHQAFYARHFHGEKGRLEIPTGEESLNRILGRTVTPDQDFALSEEQRAIVQESLQNDIMILAGPGSGKTKTIVHRAAWLVRAKRVPWGSILIVAFNRSTVLEIRHRLKRLIGRDSRWVHVQTYHGLALRIAGRSMGSAPEKRAGQDFEKVMADAVREANRILEGLQGRDRDEMTGGLLGRLRFILVDEYQDVNADQYRMISLLARKDEPQPEHRIHLQAVGDDDQNIYTWNGADVRFLRRFTSDFHAVVHRLLTNYRSSPEIVARTASFIARNPGRMKNEVTMVSARAGHLAGTREGVRFLAAPAGEGLFVRTLAEIRSMVSRGFALGEIAILCRHNEDVLKLRFLAEKAGFPAAILRKPQFSVLRLREVQRFLERLKEAALKEPAMEKVSERIQELRGDRSNLSDHPWEMLIDSVLEQYFEETAVPSLADAFHFFMDSLREFRQGETRRPGFLSLATMHAAKGLEFPAVIVLLDGVRQNEEERRLVYVAMTRAREALSVVSSRPGAGFAAEIRGRDTELGEICITSPESDACINEEDRGGETRVVELGPKDVFLSWPSSSRQIIDTVSALDVGSKGEFLAGEKEFRILVNQIPVALSSKYGHGRLQKFRGMTCIDATCYAILVRSRSDETREFQTGTRNQSWEVPLFQLTFSGNPGT